MADVYRRWLQHDYGLDRFRSVKLRNHMIWLWYDKICWLEWNDPRLNDYGNVCHAYDELPWYVGPVSQKTFCMLADDRLDLHHLGRNTKCHTSNNWSSTSFSQNLLAKHSFETTINNQFFMYFPASFCSSWDLYSHTVDGRNPAPPGMYKILQIMGHLSYQLVQDFFHQQYVDPLPKVWFLRIGAQLQGARFEGMFGDVSGRKPPGIHGKLRCFPINGT